MGCSFDTSKLWCSKETKFDAGGTHKVGELGVSPYGCTDMAGNAWQWCKDWYDANYWKTDHGADPQGPSYGSERAVRGGYWGSCDPMYFRAASRGHCAPTQLGLSNNGFRCVAPLGGP